MSSLWAATAEELQKVGQEWQEISDAWAEETARHQERAGAIERSSLPDKQKEILQKKELNRHKKRSKKLARRRNSVHNKIIEETNARLGQNKGSQGLRKTAGTKVHQPGHRGMSGDLDLGGSPRAAEKMRQVVEDMGIKVKVREHAGTISFGEGEGFELTVNKEGLAAKPGSEFHKIQVEIDAANPETYVSESMQTKNAQGEVIKRNAATDYVEVQDHRRKALKGLTSSETDLIGPKGKNKMQAMAKGTQKVLAMKKTIGSDKPLIKRKTLRKIIGKVYKTSDIKEQNVLVDEFLKKISTLKAEGPLNGGKMEITDPIEARKIREVCKDIFSTAENITQQKAQKEFASLREQIAQSPPNSPQRKALENEYLDSMAKKKASKTVNDDIFSGKRAPEPEIHRPVPQKTPGLKKTSGGFKSDVQQITRRGWRRAVDRAVIKAVGHKGARRIKVAGKILGGVMLSAAIGNASQVTEEYMEGKRPLIDVVKAWADIPLGGAISTGETLGTKYRHKAEMEEAINRANKQNMEAFLQQWVIRLRKAGLSKKEARRYVGTAVELGNLAILEEKAASLRAQGKKITSPQLIVVSYESIEKEINDTAGTRFIAVMEGLGKGAWDGTKYIITAPYRMVTAWAEGDLAEAELHYTSVSSVARMKVTLYRRLRQAGVSSKRALEAVNDWEEGKFTKLKKLFREKKGGTFVSVHRHQKDWYCTNRPVISSDAAMTEMINEEIDRRNIFRSLFGLPKEEKLQ